MSQLYRFRIPFDKLRILSLSKDKCGMTIVTFLITYFLVINSVYALDLSAPNNKIGIHLAQPHLDDLQKTKELVNSNGGDWGYVTLVIQENDRDKNKWQEVFDRMRKLHLIPIIRLATVPEGAKWRRPSKEEADSWVNFLDSLHWVIKDRYIILFNEPNQGAEWGGEVDAQNYAEVALEFAKKLKSKNPDFFIMLAGLDASAPSSPPLYEDEGIFLQQISNYQLPITKQASNNQYPIINNVFNFVDGLASHSYPNPDFSGSPYNNGRGSVRTYEWELNLFNQFGVKNLPVFITETGWIRGDENVIAEYFKVTYENIWLPDSRIAAVTPFVFDYQGEPFLNFSWKRFRSNDFYPQYFTVRSLAKVKGNPVQIEKGEIDFDFPKELVAHSNYHFRLRLKNSGQTVWDKVFGYQLSVVSNGKKPFEYFFSDLQDVDPFSETEVDLYLKTNGTLGKRELKVVMEKDSESILEGKSWKFEIFPLPSLNFKTSFYPKLRSNGNDLEMQVFNEDEEIVFKQKNLLLNKGTGSLKEVKNIAFGKKYRVVLLKRYYLPRQGFVTFQKDRNELKFERMWPIDFKPDGKFDLEDILALIKNPKLINLFFP